MDEPEKPLSKALGKLTIDQARFKNINKRARKLEGASLRHAHRFIVGRWANVYDVRRRIAGWLFLVALLIGLSAVQILWYQMSYTIEAPIDGGTYSEGVVGPLVTINPLFVASPAERSASRLVFSGLLGYDSNNRLSGDLAESWTASDDGKTYTVTLRDDVRWHDGEVLSSDDVVFTINLIKDPAVASPLRASWSSIDVVAKDERTIVFTLPSAYAPFPHALTLGIVPQHVLANVASADIRGDDFSLQPVGSGSFSFARLQTINAQAGRIVVSFEAFDEYFKGAAKLDRLQLYVYENRGQLQSALLKNEVNAVSDMSSNDAQRLATRSQYTVADVPLSNGAYVFFNTSSGSLLADKQLRQALRLATNTAQIRAVLHNRVLPLQGPVLSTQTSSIGDLVQPWHNKLEAAKLLDLAGWKLGPGGIRSKDNLPLTVNLVGIDSGDFPEVVERLSEQWKALGIDVKLQKAQAGDAAQNVLQPRAYDALVYELALGADPDVYAYWHSSQASSGGLNLANYSSPLADDALDSARSRSEPLLRDSKYRSFMQTWLEDVPAVALYQPMLHYVSTKQTRTVTNRAPINSDTDRYRQVDYWTAQQGEVFQTP